MTMRIRAISVGPSSLVHDTTATSAKCADPSMIEITSDSSGIHLNTNTITAIQSRLRVKLGIPTHAHKYIAVTRVISFCPFSYEKPIEFDDSDDG